MSINYVNWMAAAAIGYGFGQFFAGWNLCMMWQVPKAERRMRAEVLGELLQTAPNKRSERILDLCFYVVSNKEEKEVLVLPNEVLPEIYRHLEKRIRREGMLERESKYFKALTEIEFLRYRRSDGIWDSHHVTAEDTKFWDIPTVERPMGFEKEIERVQKRIEEYKNGKEDADKERVGEVLSDFSLRLRNGYP
ncbi:hypothetical protein EAF04_008113 [Stromatinia cepivora]|nr:hypothetical protein EAF04_008113 [Stromatinia cepivora]